MDPSGTTAKGRPEVGGRDGHVGKITQWMRGPRGLIARGLIARVGLSIVATVISLGFVEVVVSALDPYGVSYFPNLHRYDAEALAPVDDPELLFVPRPSIAIDAGVPIRTNALGLRGPELAVPKPAGSRRILFIGDSVTFGWGVQEDQAFPARVEARLAAGGHREMSVVNGGVVHYNTVQESRFLRRILPRVDPDLVVVVYSANDLYVADRSPIEGRQAPPEKPANLNGLVSDLDWWLLSNQIDSSLAHLLRFQTATRLSQVDADAPDAEEQRRVASVLAEHLAQKSPQVDPLGCVEALLDMRRQCAERGVEFAVAPFDAPEVLLAFCRDKEIPLLTNPGVANDPQYRVSATDAHPNAAGHDRIAESFVRSILERGLVPSRASAVTFTASSPVVRSTR